MSDLSKVNGILDFQIFAPANIPANIPALGFGKTLLGVCCPVAWWCPLACLPLTQLEASLETNREGKECREPNGAWDGPWDMTKGPLAPMAPMGLSLGGHSLLRLQKGMASFIPVCPA